MAHPLRRADSPTGPTRSRATKRPPGCSQLEALPFKPFEFHGYLGKRRIVSFGWRYDYAGRALRASEPIPDFLEPLRQRAAAVAGLDVQHLQQALVTEYDTGVTIGWHRDKPMFEDVVALSFLSTCRLRLRRKHGARWERWSTRDRAALDLPAERCGAARMGAQHPAGRGAALFGDLPQLRCRLRRSDDRRQLDPDRRVIAGLLPAAHLAIDARRDETLRDRRVQEKVVDAEAGIRAARRSGSSPRTCRSRSSGWSLRTASVQPCLASLWNAARVSGRNSASSTQRSGL